MSGFDLAFTSALVDFVWQGTLVAVALQLGLFATRRASAQFRYGLSAAALLLLIVLPIVTTVSRYNRAGDHPAAFTATPFAVIGTDGTQRVAEVNIRREPAMALTTLQPWILPIWSFGVVLLSLRLVAGGFAVRSLRRSACRADDALRARVSQLAIHMGIRRHVDVVTSVRSESPGAIGWLRPLILLPPATVIGLTATQLDAVLAHELAHIRRHDFAVNIVQMIAETLLFYHPAVWWVSNRLRIERELCCDDEAVRVCGDRTAYARALVTMAKLQKPALVMSATGGSFRDRIHRLLGLPTEARSAKVGGIVIAVALIAIALASVDAQQTRARFEVASVKFAAPEDRPGWVAFLPGGLVRGTAVPLRFVIARAYNVPWKQLEGDSQLLNLRYTIQARADVHALPAPGSSIEATIRAQSPMLREMLQSLLFERFKLAIHVERRDSPIYALVVGTKGHRLTPAARNCGPRTAEEAEGVGPCGQMGGGPANGYRLRNAEVSDLASALSVFLDRTVVDRTGVSGRFDIDVPPWSTGAPPRPDANEPQPDPNGPSIFAVLQPFGLRLEPARGPIDYYVVDHVERPTDN